MEELLQAGRLPITMNNVEIIVERPDVSPKKIINESSADAGLTLIGFLEDTLKHNKTEIFSGYDDMGTILFVNSQSIKVIE
jgi:hypothetical protein